RDELDVALFSVDAAEPAPQIATPAVTSLLAASPSELPVSPLDDGGDLETGATGGDRNGGGGLKGSGGPGDSEGSGKGRGVDFFGTEAAGNSFVFLVDCSGSMQGRRFQRARAELFKTLLQLSEPQTFFI